MESNGKPGMIQCSQTTADLLISAGKGSWVTKRDEMVQAKGKGMMQTYWVEPRNRGASSSRSPSVMSDGDNHADPLDLGGPIRRDPDLLSIEALVDQNMQHFEELVKRIAAQRSALEDDDQHPKGRSHVVVADPVVSPRSEMAEIIQFPSVDLKVNVSLSSKAGPHADDGLAPEVADQLRHLISTVGHLYRYVHGEFDRRSRALRFSNSDVLSSCLSCFRVSATTRSTTLSTRRT
jgi:hypothetical protein